MVSPPAMSPVSLHAPGAPGDVCRHPVASRLSAVVIGAVGSTRVLIEELARAPDWDVALVLTLPETLHGRHSDIEDLDAPALAAGARLVRLEHSDEAGVGAALRKLGGDFRPDYLFVVGWSQIVAPAVLRYARRGAIGYHPAPLPRLRGRAPIPWTIMLGEPITASSLFWIGEGIDDGDLLAQEYFHVAPDETAASLYARHMAALRAMLRPALAGLARGEEPRKVQDERHATWSARRIPADGEIDWHQDAVSIDRLVRAVGRPYPGAFTHVGSRRLTIWSARPVPGAHRHHALPGQVVEQRGEVLLVMTGEGLLEVEEWQVGEEGAGPRRHAVLGRAMSRPLD